MKTLILTLGLLIAAGCGGDGDDSGHDADHSTMDTLPDDFDDATELATDNGSYFVSYASDPSPLPYHDYFDLTISVHSADQSSLVADAQLAADAIMPAHGHGMNTEPVVTASGDGTFLVEGMLFHMQGYWQLIVDVDGPDGADSVTFEIDCCE